MKPTKKATLVKLILVTVSVTLVSVTVFSYSGPGSVGYKLVEIIGVKVTADEDDPKVIQEHREALKRDAELSERMEKNGWR